MLLNLKILKYKIAQQQNILQELPDPDFENSLRLQPLFTAR